MTRVERRAFSKALRASFHWHDDSVTLFPDRGKNFYFRAGTLCGGLCLHGDCVTGHDGLNHPRLRYSIHT